MNTLQIQRKLDDLESLFFGFDDNKLNDIKSIYKSSIKNNNIPNDDTIEVILNYLSESKLQIDLINKKLNEIHNDFSVMKIGGIDLPPELPESARHLWSTCQITKRIYCERKELPINLSSNLIKIKFPNEQLLPIFEIVNICEMLVQRLLYLDIGIVYFENQWKEKVINPLSVVLRDYQPDHMQDCLGLIIHALIEEENRNAAALLQQEV